MTHHLVAALVAATALAAPMASARADPLPSFLADTDAQLVTIEETETIRGEGVPRWLVKLAVRQVGSALGQRTAVKLEAFLQQTETPSFRDYKRAFGNKTALILSLLPPALQPQIAR